MHVVKIPGLVLVHVLVVGMRRQLQDCQRRQPPQGGQQACQAGIHSPSVSSWTIAGFRFDAFICAPRSAGGAADAEVHVAQGRHAGDGCCKSRNVGGLPQLGRVEAQILQACEAAKCSCICKRARLKVSQNQINSNECECLAAQRREQTHHVG